MRALRPNEDMPPNQEESYSSSLATPTYAPEQTQQRIQDLDAEMAHLIIRHVSQWGGNRRRLQAIDVAPPDGKSKFEAAIRKLLAGHLRSALEALLEQPGVSLVMASKVYRFCCPQAGAAVDRHCSYFFNSLRLNEAGGTPGTCTRFKREWADGNRRSSRLATFTRLGHEANANEYVDSYLPLVAAIADWLNREGIQYICAASSTHKPWRPADVEMAAYHWWSRNGPS